MNHVTEQIETYLTNGLEPRERDAFDAHIAECPTCSAVLNEVRELDTAMKQMFSSAHPSKGLEERVVASLRKRETWTTRRIVHPMVRRVAVGLAASMVLGTVGYVVERIATPGHGTPLRISANLKTLGKAATMPHGQSHVSSSNSVNAPEDFKYRQIDNATEMGMGRRLDSLDHTWMASRYPSAASRAGDAQAPSYNYFNSFDRRKSNAGAPTVPDFSDAPDFSLNSSAPVIAGVPSAAGLKLQQQPDQAAPNPRRGVTLNYDVNDAYLLPTDGVVANGTKSADVAHSYFSTNAIHSDLLLGNIERPIGNRDASAIARRAYVGGQSESEKDAKIAQLQDAAAKSEKASSDKDAQIAQLTSDKTQLQTSLTSANDAVKVAQVDIKQRGEGRILEANAVVEQIRALNPTDGGNVQIAKVINEEPHPPAKPDQTKPADAPPPKPPAPDNVPKPQAADTEATRPAPVIKPKIIRTGEMEFEVDSFDSSVLNITKIVAEEGGYVSTTNSDKLPNGKVKGSIVLRVVPERLETLVLKLRGIGDLKTQRIAALDITKQYTDLSSALRAAQAMQERLLDIIKNGKGTVKDLLEAEKQLGVWREKLEQLEGEIRYYDSQVALSTLTLTLVERDIRMAAVASESETVTMSLETEKVEDAYAKAKDAVVQVKGRIINSSLKQFDAGQYGATISAAVPPDSADAFIGRLKQIEGRVARFDRARSQTTSNGNNPVDPRSTDAVKVKREDVVVNLTLYNLANIAPRRWTNLTLVASNVDETYRNLIEQVKSAGGRIVESQINHPRPDQTTGTIKLDIPSEKADAILLALRGMGEVLQVNTTENASTQDVTESKRGFVLTIGSLSAFRPRETQQVQLAATNVPAAFHDLLETIRVGKGRILTSHLDEQDSRNAVGTLEFELRRDAQPSLEQAMNKDGQIVSRLADHSMDTENTVDSKVHIKLTVGSSEQLPPRQTTDLSVEVQDVQKAMDDLQAAVLSAGGRQIDNPAISQGDGSQTTARVSFDVPLDKIATLVTTADEMGARKSRQTSIDARAPEGKLARARLTVTFATPAALAGSDDSIWAGIRRGLGTSLRWLSTSFTLIVIGLCVVLPWVVLVWGGWRGVKWMRKPATTKSA